MSRAPTGNDLARSAFVQLEGMITDVLNWAEALKAIGQSPSQLDPGAVLVIGNAIDDLAGNMRDRWDVIHRRNGGDLL